MSWLTRIALALTVVGTSTTLATAQQHQTRQRSNTGSGAAIDFTGVVEEIGGGGMLVRASRVDGQGILFQIVKDTKIEVTGKISPNALVPGVCIHFMANIDTKHGKVDGAVDKATLFVPDMQKQLGALPGVAKAPVENPAFAPEPKAADATRKAAGAGKKGTPSGIAASQGFEIRGRITQVQNGTVLVQTPSPAVPSVRVEFAENAEITVEMSGPDGLHLLQKGNAIKMVGHQSNQGIKASSVTVTLAPTPDPPAAAAGKKGASKRDAASRRGKRAVDAEGEDAAPKPKKRAAKKKTDDDEDDAAADSDAKPKKKAAKKKKADDEDEK